MNRTIIVPPGIGDFLWLAMKLVNTGERFNIVMSELPPQRSHQLAPLLPNLIATHEYRPNLPYRLINDKTISNTKRVWSHVGMNEFYLSANKHLEDGRRIETFLPDLSTSFKLDYTTTDEDKEQAAKLLPEGKSYIGIYTSAYSNTRNWNGWTAKEWFALIKLLKGKNTVFVVIGADYDVGTTEELMQSMKKDKIDYVNTIGEPLSVVVEILKRQSYFIGFPSGLSIMNETLGKDGTMFYSGAGKNSAGKVTPDHSRLMNAWADPARIKDGSYKGCQFCDPPKLFEWLRDVYCIFDKIKMVGV